MEPRKEDVGVRLDDGLQERVGLRGSRERGDYRCSVRAGVHAGVKKGRRLWPLADRAVPKGVGLRFEATTNAPGPYEVHWQVVNTGHEARDLAGLRGGFERSEPGKDGVR